MGKKLEAYFSASGVTKKVAGMEHGIGATAIGIGSADSWGKASQSCNQAGHK